MTWTDSDGFEHGGACNECGEPVEEEHHAYCADCYREQQGWPPLVEALEQPERDGPFALLVLRLERVGVGMARAARRTARTRRAPARLGNAA